MLWIESGFEPMIDTLAQKMVSAHSINATALISYKFELEKAGKIGANAFG